MGLPLFPGSAPAAPSAVALPDTVRVCIKTFGCSHNISDGEYMAGQLAAAGYALTDDDSAADIVIVNSCTVKGPSQESFFSLVRRTKTLKPVIIAGCVPQADRNNPQLAGLNVIGVQQIDKVVEVVAATLAGAPARMLEKDHRPALDLPKVRKNRFVEIIPISIGCLGACTYCKTKHARGHLRSYPPDDILRRVHDAIAEGVTQIWLTSEDSGAYGRDIGTNLPALLRSIIAALPDRVMLRLGMTNPPYILEHLDEIAGILNHPQVFSFIHIPVQSGSDRVLDAMRREYTVAEFQQTIDVLRSKVPDLAIATDIICGFPAEGECDFEQTLDLVRRNNFPILNISQFYPRPGTPAARMRLLPTQEVKHRSTALTALFKAQRPYESLVGTVQRVWVVDKSDDGHLVAHTKSYALVLLPLDETMLGSSVDAVIVAAGKHFVRGEIVPGTKRAQQNL